MTARISLSGSQSGLTLWPSCTLRRTSAMHAARNTRPANLIVVGAVAIDLKDAVVLAQKIGAARFADEKKAITSYCTDCDGLLRLEMDA